MNDVGKGLAAEMVSALTCDNVKSSKKVDIYSSD